MYQGTTLVVPQKLCCERSATGRERSERGKERAHKPCLLSLRLRVSAVNILSEEFSKICCRLFRDFLHRYPAQLPELPRHFSHKSRLVALAAVRYRRQERRIRLNEHALQRNFFRCLADILRLGKSHIAGKRDHEAHIQRGTHVLQRPGKAVQHPAQSAARPVLADL